MSEFRYRALDQSGKSVAGTIQAADPAEVVARIRETGCFPVEVAAEAAYGNGSQPPAGGLSLTLPGKAGRKRMSRLEVAIFTRQLADMLGAGLVVDRAFTVLIEQAPHARAREIFESIQTDLRSGKPLSESLASSDQGFPPLYVNMVRAGEISGQLDGVLARLSDFLEKEQVRRSQVISALTYPAILISVAVLAVTFLLTFVIPRLQGVFQEMGAALPLPTVILLSVTGFVARHGWALLLGGAVIGLALHRYIRTPAGRTAYDRLRLRLPALGPVARKVVSSRFARTLGTLLTGGVPILEALSICQDAVGNVVMAEAVASVRRQVQQGESIAGAMQESGAFLPVLTHMTAVGEETGSLPALLIRSADSLDFEIDSTIRRLTTLLEPVIVLAMGAFVGSIVLSILLPIFQANVMVK
ncbi:MAG: type II secretion system F family protein [Armatimonadetes bacterium]|nr:type II secretion system F family protein [Armatimonadota bacterium]